MLGRYLVEGPAHCGECHTPRDRAGGTLGDHWLAGAPFAAGEGVAPNITPGEGGIAGWSAGDIESLLETGFTPEFEFGGGTDGRGRQDHGTAKRGGPRGDRRLSEGGAAAPERLSVTCRCPAGLTERLPGDCRVALAITQKLESVLEEGVVVAGQFLARLDVAQRERCVLRGIAAVGVVGMFM